MSLVIRNTNTTVTTGTAGITTQCYLQNVLNSTKTFNTRVLRIHIGSVNTAPRESCFTGTVHDDTNTQLGEARLPLLTVGRAMLVERLAMGVRQA
eukprot:1607470-Rhodomonas_salina.1